MPDRGRAPVEGTARPSTTNCGSMHVYGRPRWQMRLLVGAMLAIGILLVILRPASGVVFLVIWSVLGGLLLLGDARTRVVASDEGLSSTPLFGRTKRYAWSEINGFTVGRITGARFGGPAVFMSV